jgi:hypothetical protein
MLAANAAPALPAVMESTATLARLALILGAKGTLAYRAITNRANTSTNVMRPRRSSK